MIRIRVLLVCLGAITSFSVAAKDMNGSSVGRRSGRIKLTGVAALPSQRFAMLQVEENGKAPVLITLREGVSSYHFQLLAIDIGKKEVLVRNCGELVRLWFDEKNPGAPACGSDPDHAPIPVTPDPNSGDI
jgi:hypothetical protein